MSVDVPERARSGLGRKFFAALAATSSKDGATGTRAHASTETVRLGAAAVVRLERTLGHDYSTGDCDVHVAKALSVKRRQLL